MKIIGTCLLLLMATGLKLAAQDKIVIDDMLAVVGKEIILRSDVMSQVEQLNSQGMAGKNKQTACEVLEDLLYQKLMLNQAFLDSVEVTDNEVDGEVDRRVQIFILQAGGPGELEKLLGKSVEEIKMQFRPVVKKQLMVERVKQKVVGNLKVTPGDVSKYFNAIPKDSLPYIPAEVQVAQIVIYPPIQKREEDRVKAELEEYRKRIMGGKAFGIIAKVNSEDEGSRFQDGYIGMVKREDLDPDFAAAAFSMQEGEVSGVVKSGFGYHLIKLMSKKGEYAEIQHILKIPQVLPDDLFDAEKKLVDLAAHIEKSDSLSFSQSAQNFSEDKETKNNGGLMINPQDGSSWFSVGQMDPSVYEAIASLKPGQMSSPVIFKQTGQKTSVRIFMLVSKKEPHVANLEQDYQKVQAMTLQEKQGDAIVNWISKKNGDIYIRLNPEFQDCNFKVNWLNNLNQ